jgi:hypothetical protein
VWAPIPWSCAAHTPVERTFAKDRAPRTQVSPARPRQISGPARGVEVGPARQRSSDGNACLQIVRAGVTGAPLGVRKSKISGSSTSTMPPSKRTPKLSASFYRGRRAKPAGVIRSRRPGGAVDGSALRGMRRG